MKRSKRRNKPPAVFDYQRTNEAVWRDPRTGTILAPGAIQNWPTKADQNFIALYSKSANQPTVEI